MRIFFAGLALLGAFAARADAGAMFTWGLRLGTPQLASASAGWLIGPLDAPARPADAPPPEKMYLPRGVLIQVEPGIGGGKVALGFAKGLPNVAAGGLKVFYLRTWGQPLWVDKSRSYVGGEADLEPFMLKL